MASSSSVNPSLGRASYVPRTSRSRSNSILTLFTLPGKVLKKIEFTKETKETKDDPNFLGKGSFGVVRGSQDDPRYVAKSGNVTSKGHITELSQEKYFLNKVFGTTLEPAAEIYYFLADKQKRLSDEEAKHALTQGKKVRYRLIQIRHHGMDLHGTLNNFIHDPIKILILLIQTAEALQTCHSIYNIIHGDPSTGNFMVIDSSDGSIIRPIDFGCAYHHREKTGVPAKAFTTYEKCAYWSPDRTEVFDPKHVVLADAKQDVFSLGKIIHSVANRLPPYSNIAIELNALSSVMLRTKTRNRIDLKDALNYLNNLLERELNCNLPYNEVAKKTEQARRTELMRRAELGRKLESKRQAEQCALAQLTKPVAQEEKREEKPETPTPSESKREANPAKLKEETKSTSTAKTTSHPEKSSTEQSDFFQKGIYKNQRLTLFTSESIERNNLSFTEKTLKYLKFANLVSGLVPGFGYRP